MIQGPVFYDLETLSWIGDEGEREIAVPDAAFKVVIRFKNEEGEGQRRLHGIRRRPRCWRSCTRSLGPATSGREGDYRHARFLTTVDEIERLTGLDFKPSEDPGTEKRLERRRANGLWEPSVVDLKQRRTFVPACRSRS